MHCLNLHVFLLALAAAQICVEENGSEMHPSCHTQDVAHLMQLHPKFSGGQFQHNLSGPPTYFPGFWPKFAGKRIVELLDGEWQWGLYNEWYSVPFIDSMAPINTKKWDTPNKVQVPHSWDAEMPGTVPTRGVAVYRRTFRQIGNARLQFMACSFYCRVFVDGLEIGSHLAGGYTPFWLDVPATNGSQERELFVLTDNRYNFQTAPMHEGSAYQFQGPDFWQYGGIVRSVLLHHMPDEDAWVWRAFVLPSAEFGYVDVNISLTSPYSGDVEYELAFDGEEASEKKTASGENGIIILRDVKVPKPRQWSLSDPQLHTMNITVDGASVIERFGLRYVTSANGQLTLNGEKVKLKGFNRHNIWIENGMSPTTEELDKDVELVAKSNANFVRGAHYPQDQRWLDRMDEAGIGMWEETMGPAVTLQDIQKDYFMKYQLQQMDEMMAQSMNHPSIFVWGWFNEGPSNEEDACPGYAACFRQAAWDVTRLRTYASKYDIHDDKCLEYLDVVSANKYPGWYEGLNNLSYVEWYWNSQASQSKAKYPDKPYWISEAGAGGIASWTDKPADEKWGVPYQSSVLEADIQAFYNNSDIGALVIWQFSDVKANDMMNDVCGPCNYEPDVYPPVCSSFGSWWNVIQGPSGLCFIALRPGGLNNKGVLDAWRQAKPSYDTVKEHFTSDL